MQKALQTFLTKHQFQQIKLKAVLFDMDGVLFDSMKNHTEAWFRTATEMGIECTQEEFFLHEGRVGSSTINLLYNRTFGRDATDDEKEIIYNLKTFYFNALPPVQPMPGALDLLMQVKAADLTPIVVTGSGQKSLLDKLNHNFPEIFKSHLMVTAYDVQHGKPHPEPYLKGLKKGNVHPWEAIVVENAPMGVESASAANIFTLAVNTGPLDEQVLYNAGADYVLPSMNALNDQFAVLKNMIETTLINQ